MVLCTIEPFGMIDPLEDPCLDILKNVIVEVIRTKTTHPKIKHGSEPVD